MTMVDASGVQEAILTTLLTSGSATILATLFGVPLGAWCSARKGPMFERLRIAVTALYGLPPVVVGVFVYSMLSKSGMFGGLDLLFTVEAMIIAQTCLIFPLLWGGSWSAFDSVATRYKDTLDTLGATPRQRFAMEIRLARTGVYHAIVIGFGRAIAEVGAVIMVGGNIAGQTRVMTTSIVLETSKGNMDDAALLGWLLLLFSLSLVGLASLVRRPWPKPKAEFHGAAPPPLISYEGPGLHRVGVERDGRVLLQPLDVKLKSGTITVVLGESGSGKTSLLRCLAGLEDVSVPCGFQRCSYVPQAPVSLTGNVAEELDLVSKLFPQAPLSGTYYRNAFSLGVEASQAPERISGGELQRLVLARQLAFAPSLLLLDEATANLGGMHVKAIEDELIRHRDAGCCIVLATHNVLQAKRLADEMIILHEGGSLDGESQQAKALLEGTWPI